MAMIKNGRQTAPTLDRIREDHVARYQLAIDHARRERLATVVDIGTGTGYGAWMMAEAGLTVEAYEIDQSAIDYGQQHYYHDRLARIQADIATLGIPQVDLLTGFEIVEHSSAAPAFLKRASRYAKWLIASVPNEDVVPFVTSKHRQHVRHYTPKQFRELLECSGWEVIGLGCQVSKRGDAAEVVFNHTAGRTLIAVCRSR
jgi:2-polyprenyl-3-methyl-5-hydroxy-6-metoxy-1,4-benzoquinol methylase